MKASEAQAKLLARLWGGNNQARVSSKYVNFTVRACIKRGWLEATESTGSFPDGSKWTDYRISKSGVAALTEYLNLESAE